MTTANATPAVDKPTHIETDQPSKNVRRIMAFPDIYEFYEILMDRLYMVLGHFFFEEQFTLYINALPRKHEPGTVKMEDRFAGFPLLYGGIKQQRKFLEPSPVEKLTKYWNQLDEALFSDIEANITSDLYRLFKIGKLGLSQIPSSGMGKLMDYFHPIITKQKKDILKEAEYHILNHHLDIKNYRYLSLPLIQFGEFDGVVHIIYHEKDHEQFYNGWSSGKTQFNKKLVGNIIKALSREYEGLVLDWWDKLHAIKYKENALNSVINNAVDPQLFATLNTNPILNELGFHDYYVQHKDYLFKRLKSSNEIPDFILTQYRQNAIMSIIIDSYAHNVSAHSLTALEWWFRQRAEQNEEKANKLEKAVLLEKNKALNNRLRRPLDKETHNLMRFLQAKGAFWTGLSRDHHFGGKVSSLFSVLWYDFVNNPLYLGTMAFSEDIHKIKLHITFLERVNSDEHRIRIQKRVVLDDVFVEIDLSDIYDDKREPVEKSTDFIIKGDRFEEISEILKKYRAFFPGGVVGRHAFFTILENEIRNVKHFPEDQLAAMREEGLPLNISIEEDSYDNSGLATYYKIGVWIRRPVRLTQALLQKRIDRLDGDIIGSDDHKPRFGGIFQDKICAAMLFNNSFSSVQNQKTVRDKRFYPWVKAGSSPQLIFRDGDLVEDVELSVRKFKGEEYTSSRDYFTTSFQEHTGYFKKFFHLWRGEDILPIQADEDLKQLGGEWENLSRFRFVSLANYQPDVFQRVREEGIIRVVESPVENLDQAYRKWLTHWMKAPAGQAHPATRTHLVVNGQVIAQLDFDETGARYRNQSQLSREPFSVENRLNLVHGHYHSTGGKAQIRYRSHGILKQTFCRGKELHHAVMPEALAAELIEVLSTRICIFDNRIANRLHHMNQQVLEEQLHCTVRQETMPEWNEVKQGGFLHFHFLVVHLSFIEAMETAPGIKPYEEEDIKNFIEQEILQEGPLPENFVLVVTTGRGRTQWWAKLKEYDRKNKEQNQSGPSFSSFVTFRPVETLLSAVENSVGLEDDIELKYRLVKVLFGS